MIWDILLALSVFLVVLLLGLALVVRYWQLKPVVYKPLPEPSSPPRFLTFVEKTPFISGQAKQSESWFAAMSSLGDRLRSHGVTHVYFLHGTFTGDDPLGVVRGLRAFYPHLSHSIEIGLRRFIRSSSNRWLKDSGNFTPAYVALFQKAIGPGIQCQEIIWSSENHHVGRLRGASDLVSSLTQEIESFGNSRKPRFLLWGHSHAGQLFALTTLLLAQDNLAQKILDLAFSPPERDELSEKLNLLKTVACDWVTLGTPIRYPWGNLLPSHSVLHIVNHRGPHMHAGPLSGMPFTMNGDYIHQLGVAGSDLLAPSKPDREINRTLDPLLGPGIDWRTWLRLVKQGRRVSDKGITLLINYRDQGRVWPNGAVTLFGHGIYTRFRTMLFNLEVVVQELYPKKKG